MKYLRLASESGSDFDEERSSVTSDRERTRAHTFAGNNRSQVRSLLNRCSLRTTILFVSLVGNATLITTMLLTDDSRTTGTLLPCDTEMAASEGAMLEAAENKRATVSSKKLPDCETYSPNLESYRASNNKYEDLFEDLSESEISSVFGYLSRQRELGIQPIQVRDASHVYSIELHIPNKTDAIKYMDERGLKPVREARVVIERPGLPVPVSEEYVVGPLPIPRYHYANPRRERSTVPYRFHPTYGIRAAYMELFRKISPELNAIIRESYGATFVKCSQNCLLLLPQRTSSAYSDSTLIVLSAYYATDFTTVNPVGLAFLMKETKKDSQQFELDSMFYGGQLYKSLQEFVNLYKANTITKSRMSYPTPASNQTSNAGTMNLRGRPFPVFPQAGPREFEPDGKRYSVTGQHVQYMEWSFNFRMSASSGPQVWDIRWAGERIVYEISLQEVTVIYAGANPKMFYSHLSDSAFGLGENAVGLVPGVDCPEHATFLPQTLFQTDINGPQTLPNAFCLFEHNTGLPLRRHRSADDNNGRNYGGVVDRVLILRTIIVEYNYDYIFDLVFHLNGAIEIKTHATGYVMSQMYNEGESPFGFRIHENVIGSIHHHLINYKIDLDIQGQANRYETLDFVVDERPWPWYRTGKETFQQISFKHNLKHTERDAVLFYNFSTPKYHIVYNDKVKNKFGTSKAYRIASTGFTKQILSDNSEVLKSRQWSKYQMLVTRRHDVEESSSSIFSMFDGESPYVDIDRYLQNNENIIDQDLVFWVTVGFHHLPHTEDIPNTPTVGADATVSLLPYNYFPECPTVASRDAIRLDLKESHILLQDYETPRRSRCIPKGIYYSDRMFKKSNLFP
uniref:Amine oxidase n=1 Tax=Arion vulgaris TaxID=1028688 RepID=A0A0B6ZXL0_9EUPU